MHRVDVENWPRRHQSGPIVFPVYIVQLYQVGRKEFLNRLFLLLLMRSMWAYAPNITISTTRMRHSDDLLIRLAVPRGSVRYGWNTSSCASLETEHCGSPRPKSAHYCPSEQLVWFIKCFPRSRAREASRQQNRAAIDGWMAAVWGSRCVLQVKYDWLVCSWVNTCPRAAAEVC